MAAVNLVVVIGAEEASMEYGLMMALGPGLCNEMLLLRRPDRER